ncbi:MAG TPA: glutamate synthase large subunit, partial [Terriglobales bacterium]|nr:glutamate synthase large subunit [Terriglobales bacterium]
QAQGQEPWDGPAALVFTDGSAVGAKLDRNGLRPLRYTLTSDGLLVVGSEAGIADLQGKRVIERQRLGPGELLLLQNGKLIRPGQWPELPEAQERLGSDSALDVAAAHSAEPATPRRTRTMAALGWTEDRLRLLFQPLVQEGKEAVWSMGDDVPPAFLSNLQRPLWDYCKQRFAQVTNPSIDPLRERQVMSLEVYTAKSTVLPSPLLGSAQMQALTEQHPPAQRIDLTFNTIHGVEGALAALARVCEETRLAIGAGACLLILSDREVSAERAALPALLATSAAWKAAVEAGGWKIPLIVETGQMIDTHHVALLVAEGASAVFPWLALELATEVENGAINFRTAVENGLRKTMARMGVSTVASYRNSQLFEVVGLDSDICDHFFEDAHRTLGGKNLRELLQDALDTHTAAFACEKDTLRDAGFYRFRHQGETHGNSPDVVRRMHQYIKSPSEKTYQAFAEVGEGRGTAAIRDLLEIVPHSAPAAHAHVESEASILSRFSTQAMSLGAISPEAHRTLAIAMNRLGARSNTGEGGEDPRVYRQGGLSNNRVKQVASARFGVTTEYLVHADELEIKIAQGAKPGEGGQLPASKVTPYIARLRHAVPNMSLISPPPHHDIYSIEDLAQLIYDLRAVNPHARIGVKLVSSGGVGMIAAGVAKAGADVITISGHDGGTGASPMTSIKNTGLPWEVGLRDAHCTLVRAGLRGRVRLRVDGGLKFARDVIIAALLGAEEFGFATAALLAIGCVMARQCHLNTCPVGIATQDEKLRTRFAGKPEMVMQYFRALAVDIQQMLGKLGAASIDEIVGAVERLSPRNAEAGRALGTLLQAVEGPTQPACPREDSSRLHREMMRPADGLEELRGRRRFRIANCDRAIGAHLSGELLRREDSVDAGPLSYEFLGTAGQSFGAFLTSGVHFRLLGEANDYVGKGMSGGTIVITHGPEASRRGDVLAGNTVLYGATAGELYVAGRAGERLAVRNSGALAVVEGAGQHCCEYMTAGIVLVLGPAGTNLGAGMTGGLAYVLPDAANLAFNQESVRLVEVEMTERRWLRRVLRNHVRLTGSPRAMHLLND